jgi:DNA-binding transcriptional MerR regulator
VIFGISSHYGLAEGQWTRDDVCNKDVIKYLKSVGFSASEVKTICAGAKAYVGLSEGNVNKYEALVLHIEQMSYTKNWSQPISQRVINHVVRLIRPAVCNEHVARYLKSEGFHIDSIVDICNRAESLVEESNLSKTEAIKKSLREHSLNILQINDKIIREVARLTAMDDIKR